MRDRLHLVSTRLARWPLGARLVAFVVGLLLLWLPVALVVCVPLALRWGVQDNTTNLVTVVTLYLAILLAVWGWGRWVRGNDRPLVDLGWDWRPALGREIALGVAIAVLSMSALFGLEAAAGWLTFVHGQPLNGQPVNWTTVWLNGLATGAGVAFLEELFFRGWFLSEFRQDFSRRWAAFYTSLIFATLHYLKPIEVLLATWPQLPGLTLLGLAMVQARACGGPVGRGSLGVPIGMHGGWVCAVTVASLSGLVRYTGAVPAWVTGIGGNPLAGVVGFGFLAAVGMGLRRWASLRRALAR